MNNNEVILNKLRQVESAFEELFGPRLTRIAEIDAKRIKIAGILSEEKIFYTNDPNLALVRLVSEINEGSNNNALTFLRNLRKRKAQIIIFESELSTFVLKELDKTEKELGSEEQFDIFMQLYREIITNPSRDYILGFIKTSQHMLQLLNALDSIRNTRIANRMREVIKALTDEELVFLIRYLAEINSWKTRESIREDVPFFQRQITSFLYGRGENYLGLLSHFKDEKLAERLKQNPAFLQLTRYNLMLLYLRKLREKISTYKSGDWTQFEEVYNNINKIANTFVMEFGNSEIASELFQEKKEFREYPERWLMDVDRKLAELSSAEHRRSKVITPFIIETEKIFTQRATELSAMAKPEISELKDVVEDLIRKRIESERKTAGEITQELEKTRENSSSRLKKLRKRFEGLSNSCIDALHNFVSTKFEVIDKDIKAEYKKRLGNARAFLRYERRLLQYIHQRMGKNLEIPSIDPLNFFALMFSLNKAKIAFSGAIQNVNSTAAIFINRSTLRKIRNLDNYLKIAENAYSRLDEFILLEFGFLVKASQTEQRREDHARAATTS